jgi:energy-coupling factor transporter ATP-binding protein EcfA2
MLAPKEEVVPFPPLYRRVRVEGPDVDGDYEYYGASQKAAIYFCRAKRLFIQKIDREWILFKPDVDNRPEKILAKSDAHGSINSATKLEDPPHDKWTSSLRFSQLPSVTSIAALRNRVADSKEYFRSIFGDSADNPQLMRCLGRFDGVPVGTLREPVVALLGRAGSGKSTLLNALLGDKLLPANKERIAATQTSVDLMVDPHVAEYTVRVRFVGRERWRARRSALVRSVLQRDEDSAEDGAAEACEDKAEAADILELLYGAQRSKDEAFLAKLEQLPPEEDDPNPAIAQALRDGTRVTQHGFVESMRELLFQLVAVPKRNAPEAEKQRALFPVVEKVWVSGPFPKAIVPAGMHVVDVPGVQDVSRDREAVARAAIESATLVLITASGAATAERPFVSAMIRNEIDSAKRRGQQCVLVLTGSDKFFKKKEETARARIESDIEEARRRGIDVPIVHTAARSYFKKEGNPSPPTRYGASLLVPYMQEELQRVTARVPELFGLWEQAWRASVEEWQQLTISPPSGSPASKASSGTQSPSHKAAAGPALRLGAIQA